MVKIEPDGLVPQPTIIADKTPNNTDQQQDPNVEKSFAGTSFHFTSTHEPQEDASVYETNQKFVKAMIERTIPTLLVSGKNYANLRELCLVNTAPYRLVPTAGAEKRT